MSMVFIMRGTTLSGKDTFIKDHFKDEGAVLSSDYFRAMVCGDVSIQNQNKMVFDTLYQILEYRLINRVEYTVLNATNIKYKDTSRAIELCKKYKVPYTILSITPPTVSELERRNLKRFSEKGIHIPPEVIQKHHDRYELCKEPFVKDAINNPHCSFIEFDQDYNVVTQL